MAVDRHGYRETRASLLSYIAIAIVAFLIGGLVTGFVLLGPTGQKTSPPGDAGKKLAGGVRAEGRATDLEEFPPRSSVTEVAEKVGPAVVKISTLRERVFYNIFFERMVQQEEGLGSGVIIDSEGHVLTNFHVIEKAKEIGVVLTDGREFEADVVGGDYYTDLAVLKIRKASNLPVAPLRTSGRVVVGELAVAIGNPYGFDHTVTAGVISALGRSIPLDENEGAFLENLIQTDAPINPGNSGGALVGADGKVIGINTAIIQQAQGIGFAIPINRAMEVANELIKYGKVKRPWIGAELWEITPDDARRYGLAIERGIAVMRVYRGSPAARAGLGSGDVIVAVDGRTIEKLSDLTDAIKKAGIGGRLRLTILRNTRRIDTTLVVGEMP